MKPRALGNLLETPLDQIWMGSAATRIRKAIERGKLDRACRCGHCPWQFKPRVPRDLQWRDLPEIIEFDLPNTHCNIGGEDPTTGQGACIMCPRAALDFRPEPDRCDG